MMINWMRIAAIVSLSASLAGTAAADLIAGWDFSQYRVDGSLDAGAGPVDTLPANYSSLDATFGAGGTGPGNSGAFGTLYMDGSNGSTDVTENAPSPGPEVVAHANNVTANRLAPLDFSSSGGPVNVFDAFNVLLASGQTHQSRVGLTALTPADLVFEADQGAAVQTTWAVSFAAYALDVTGTVSVDVEVATDCSSYSFVDSVLLTEAQQAYSLPLAALVDDAVCVRLRLDTANGQPVIDNVAVPEPGLAAMLVAGVLALAGLERRRRT